MCEGTANVRKAKHQGQVVAAGPDTAEVAICPACGCEVHKRSRRTGQSIDQMSLKPVVASDRYLSALDRMSLVT
jgi:hypothetical protein